MRARVVAHNYCWARFVGLATLLATLLTIPMAMAPNEQAPRPSYDLFDAVAYNKEEMELIPYAAVQNGCMQLCCNKPPDYEGSQPKYNVDCIRALFKKASSDPCKEIKSFESGLAKDILAVPKGAHFPTR